MSVSSRRLRKLIPPCCPSRKFLLPTAEVIPATESTNCRGRCSVFPRQALPLCDGRSVEPFKEIPAKAQWDLAQPQEPVPT